MTENQNYTVDEGVSTAVCIMTANELTCTALDIGEHLLRSGAAINWVEETMERICRAYGADHVEVFTIPSYMTVSVRMPDGSYSGQMRRIKSTSYNLKKLELYNGLSRRFCRELPDFATAQALLKSAKAARGISLPLLFFGAFCGIFGFALFFGSTLLDAVVAGTIAIIMTLLEKKSPTFVNPMAGTLLQALLGASLTFLLAAVGLPIHTDTIMVALLMLIIPGLAFGTALRDLLCGDTLSGTLRAMQAILQSTMIALGFAAVLIFMDTGTMTLEEDGLTGNPYMKMAMSALCSLGYSILYGTRLRRLFPAALGGLIGFGAYLGFSYLFPDLLISNFLASLVIMLYSEVCARALRAPAMVFFTPASIPLVPGGYLYFTIGNLFAGQYELSGYYAILTAKVAIGISGGVIIMSLVSHIFRNVFSHMRRKAS